MGSSGTFPSHGRPASGYVIEQGSTRVWCDAGAGTYMSLPLDPDLIDAVVISHQHPDHCSDLTAAFHAWTYRPEPRDPVPLFAPQSVWDRLCEYIEQIPPCFDFNPVWTGDQAQIGDITVAFTEMDHSVPTVGSRWEANGRSLFFTGDTGPAGDWRELAAGVDLMISGHTHNGQVIPFNLVVNRVFEQSVGLFRQGRTRLYVSPGTGTWGPVMRLGSRGEITLFEIEPAHA